MGHEHLCLQCGWPAQKTYLWIGRQVSPVERKVIRQARAGYFAHPSDFSEY